MERMPKNGPDWKIGRVGAGLILKNVHTDPDTGVVTTWIKNPKNLYEARTDKLQDGSLTRHIHGFIKQKTEPTRFTYRIETNEGGHHKTIQLAPEHDSPSFTLTLIAEIADETEPINVYAVYPADHLKTIQISQEPRMSTYESVRQRPFSINLQELAEVYRIYGPKIAFSSLVMGIADETDPFAVGVHTGWADGFQEFEREKIYEKIDKNWTKQEQVTIIDEATRVVKDIIGENLEEFQQPDLDIISLALIDNVVGELPVDFNKNENRSQRQNIIKDLLTNGVAYLVSNRRNDHEVLGDLFVYLKFAKDRKTIELNIEGYGGEQIHQDTLKFGENYRYDNYEYLVDRNQRDKVIVVVSNILRPKCRWQIRVPQTIDIQEFTRLITLPESIGWEKALDVADIEYART